MSRAATTSSPPRAVAAGPVPGGRGGGLRRTAGRRLAYGLGLLPASAGVMTAVAISGPAGGVDAARRHLVCGGFTPSSVRDRVRGARVMVHGVLGVVVGLLFWWLAWMALLATARGPFYGFVVAGPYDDAWGGPGLVGAWAAHAWAWVGVLVVVALLWWGLAALHVRLTEYVLGTRRRRWVLPVAAVVVLAAVLLVVGWARQI
ncbi:hypothetical protein EV188_101266 [Actinomycetospora succinea]|uniref:Uncharacterized protein n=1 Tax=Actinomycetospora succinea TaxID=663603 RepID=A0A4R6VR44_9PSEU|nr:hypothetical protein [Actinomycetospora succinea]TDQ65017.1 hypothetical protein EV188_101266 [Actinomycetospora succinea]